MLDRPIDSEETGLIQTGLKRITLSTDSEGQSCSYLGTSEQNRKAS